MIIKVIVKTWKIFNGRIINSVSFKPSISEFRSTISKLFQKKLKVQ